jgi:hypothetical protein
MKEPPVETLVEVYLKIRNAKSRERKESELRQADLEKQMRTIELELMRRAKAVGVSGFTVNGVGTAYPKEEMKVSIGDDVAFINWVQKQGDLDFLQRRVAVRHLQDWLKLHPEQVPPGLNLFRELRMQVRTARKAPSAADDANSDEEE